MNWQLLPDVNFLIPDGTLEQEFLEMSGYVTMTKPIFLKMEYMYMHPGLEREFAT